MNVNRFKFVQKSRMLALSTLITPSFLLIFVPSIAQSEVVFEENFDRMPDWISDQTGGVPQGWHKTRTDPVWAPSEGHPDRHEAIEISDETVAENPNRARGGEGKSFVSWRDSYDSGGNNWNSDSILFYRLPGDGLRNIYVEFWINFSDEMVDTYYRYGLGQSKLFRVMSHDFPDDVTNNEYNAFFGDNHKPMTLWDISGGQKYGVRNFLSIYRGANETPLNDTVTGFPRNFNTGDNSLWFGENALAGQAVGGGDAVLTDYKNGGFIEGENVQIDQVFGDETVWVKMAFYYEMNSAPGVPDGKLYQYVNDTRILKGEGIAWQTSEQPADKIWNLVGIGGNDLFNSYPNEDRHEEWYAIDDLVIRSDLPEHLKTENGMSPPNPPSSIEAQPY